MNQKKIVQNNRIALTYFNFRTKYPLVHIQGEETPTFTNVLGELINLEITDNQEETIECLIKILDGNRVAAELLATEVHQTVICEHGDIEALPDLVSFLSSSSLSHKCFAWVLATYRITTNIFSLQTAR